MSEFSKSLMVSSSGLRAQAERLRHLSENISNADTPGYGAREMPDFKTSYLPADTSGAQRATRTRHLHGSTDGAGLPAVQDVREQSSPNGNQISLETEILKSVDAKRQHDRALAIYKTSIGVLRSTLRTT